MDAALFAQMLSDKKVTNLKKLGYKYPQADISEFIALLKSGFYKSVPLKDFHGNDLVYLEGTTQVHLSAAKILLTPQNSSQLYGTKAMEEEIISIRNPLVDGFPTAEPQKASGARGGSIPRLDDDDDLTEIFKILDKK